MNVNISNILIGIIAVMHVLFMCWLYKLKLIYIIPIIDLSFTKESNNMGLPIEG
jgi:hypothetical protein